MGLGAGGIVKGGGGLVAANAFPPVLETFAKGATRKGGNWALGLAAAIAVAGAVAVDGGEVLGVEVAMGRFLGFGGLPRPR